MAIGMLSRPMQRVPEEAPAEAAAAPTSEADAGLLNASFSGTNSARCAAAPTGFAAATGAVRVLTVGCRMGATWVLNL